MMMDLSYRIEPLAFEPLAFDRCLMFGLDNQVSSDGTAAAVEHGVVMALPQKGM